MLQDQPQHVHLFINKQRLYNHHLITPTTRFIGNWINMESHIDAENAASEATKMKTAKEPSDVGDANNKAIFKLSVQTTDNKRNNHQLQKTSKRQSFALKNFASISSW